MGCAYNLVVLILIWFLYDNRISFSLRDWLSKRKKKCFNNWPNQKRRNKMREIAYEFVCLCHCSIHILPSIEMLKRKKKKETMLTKHFKIDRSRHENGFGIGPGTYLAVTVSTKSWNTNVLLFIGKAQTTKEEKKLKRKRSAHRMTWLLASLRGFCIKFDTKSFYFLLFSDNILCSLVLLKIPFIWHCAFLIPVCRPRKKQNKHMFPFPSGAADS